MKHLLAFLLAIVIAAAAFPAPASAVEVNMKKIDDFIDLMKLCKNLGPETRYILWRKRYFEPDSDMLRKVVFKTTDETKIKKAMLPALDNIFKHYRLHYKMLGEFREKFPSALSEAIMDFKKYFSDTDFDKFSFYVIVGNQSFNSRVDMVEGRSAFEIAAEMFESLDGVKITIMHELFHLYHMKRFEAAGNKIEERLYFPLIFEGCAVYFSKLSTGCDIEDCMQMGFPGYLNLFDRAGFKGKCRKTFGKSAELMFDSLDKPVSGETYKKFFGSRPDDRDEPSRIGYYIGFRIIENAVSTMPLKKIIELDRAGIISLCKSELKKILSDK